jgi:hypothetical protein
MADFDVREDQQDLVRAAIEILGPVARLGRRHAFKRSGVGRRRGR